MKNLSVISNAPASRFNNADLAGIAVQIMLDVSESVRALRAAEEGNPLQASELSFFDNFAEALGLEAESPLTADLLPSAFSLGIESDSDEKHIRFSVPHGMTAELAESGSSVALRIASLEAPQSPVLLVHEDFRAYADFMRPGLYANSPVSPEHESLLRILTVSNETLGHWITGSRIKEVLAEPDPETRCDICWAEQWTWESWGELEADCDMAVCLISNISEACLASADIAEAVRDLRTKVGLIREFRLLVAEKITEFTRP